MSCDNKRYALDLAAKIGAWVDTPTVEQVIEDAIKIEAYLRGESPIAVIMDPNPIEDTHWPPFDHAPQFGMDTCQCRDCKSFRGES